MTEEVKYREEEDDEDEEDDLSEDEDDVPRASTKRQKTGDSAFIEGRKKKGTKKGGSSCHQCKSRRNFTALTYCTSNLDKKNKRCRKKFCGHCLKKFYKESASAISDKSNWKCPSCRKICCCAACRRRKHKEGGTTKPSRERVSSSSSARAAPSSSLSAAYSAMSLAAAPSGSLSTHLKRPADADDDEDSDEGDVGFMTPGAGVYHTENKRSAFGVSGSPVSGTPAPQPPARDLAALTTQSKALAMQIQRAQTELRDSSGSEFARLYAISQTPNIKKKINEVLKNDDLSQGQKVDDIAALLRPFGGS